MNAIKFPEGRTPPVVAKLIKDVIKNKVVCDLGCGDGEFMVALAKYAKEVKGVEQMEEWANEAVGKGFSVTLGNAFAFPFPEADVYYCWNIEAMGLYFKAKFEGVKGTFVFGHTIREPLLRLLDTLEKEIRQVDGFVVYIVKL